MISVAPYQADSHLREEADFGAQSETEHGCRVLACSFVPDQNAAAFFVMLDGDGEVVDFLRMKNLLKRKNSTRGTERADKVGNCLIFIILFLGSTMLCTSQLNASYSQWIQVSYRTA